MHHSPAYVFIAQRWRIPVVIELHDFYFACERAHLERVDGKLCNGPDGGRACARHCYPDNTDAGSRWALRSHMFRRALTEADAVICPSEFVARYFSEAFTLPEPPTVLGNGVAIEPRDTAPRSSRRHQSSLNLASVGVVVPHKGPHVAIEALRMARLAETRYTVFGAVTEPYLLDLRAAAERVPGLTFRAYGHFEQSELPVLLADVDVLLIPSLVWETYSIVAHEAFALGVPAVASRRGALPEAIREGENGLLFDPDRPAELADILQRLERDLQSRWALADGIERSDWVTASERAEQLESILEAAVERGTPRRARADVERDELAMMREPFRSVH
jgi:glycosyltransferase involved in cell wall biosynthesis